MRLKRIIDRLIPVNPPERHPHGGNIQWEKEHTKHFVDLVQYLGENFHTFHNISYKIELLTEPDK